MIFRDYDRTTNRTISLLLAFIILVFTPTVALSQQASVQYLTSFDDISAALEAGDITYGQYIELINLMESKIELNSGNLRRLLAIPGVEESDIEALSEARDKYGPFKSIEEAKKHFPGDFRLIEHFVEISPPMRVPINGSIRLYYRSGFNSPPYDDEPYSNLKVTLERDNIRTQWRIRRSGDRQVQVASRYLQLNSNRIELIVGNYYRKRLGYGLLVGRNISISTRWRDNSAINYIVSPYYGDPNGIFAKIWLLPKVNVSVALSANSYNSSAQYMGAFSAKFRRNRNESVGLVIYWGKLVAKDTLEAKLTQYGGSVFGERKFSIGKIRSEFAVLDNGAWGLNANLYSGWRTNLVLKFWAYHPDFLALYSDGSCDRGYETFYLDESDFYIRNYQAGELGFYSSIRKYVGENTTINLRSSFFKSSISYDNGGEIYFGATFYPSPYFDVRASVSHRFDGWGATGTSKNRIYLVTNERIMRKLRNRTSVYFRREDYSGGDRTTRYRLKTDFKWLVKSWLMLNINFERYSYKTTNPAVERYQGRETNYSYWNLYIVPSIMGRFSEARTTLSFRKVDGESGISLLVRFNLDINW